MKNNPLITLATAESSLVKAIDAATATIATIGTSAVDAALARLDAAASACHARLTNAMTHLFGTVADISETMEALAENILEDLSTDEHLNRYGSAHHQVSEPAPQFGNFPNSPSTNGSTSTATTSRSSNFRSSEVDASTNGTDDHADDDDGITLTDTRAPAVHAQESPKTARQAPQGTEATLPPSREPIQTPKGNGAAGETVLVAAIAANAPVDAQDRDDRKPAPTTSTKPRRRRKAS